MSQNSSAREKEKTHGKSVQQLSNKSGPEHIVINLNMDGGQDPYQDHPKKKSDSFRKVFQQIQKLTEDNKKIALLEE